MYDLIPGDSHSDTGGSVFSSSVTSFAANTTDTDTAMLRVKVHFGMTKVSDDFEIGLCNSMHLS